MQMERNYTILRLVFIGFTWVKFLKLLTLLHLTTSKLFLKPVKQLLKSAELFSSLLHKQTNSHSLYNNRRTEK